MSFEVTVTPTVYDVDVSVNQSVQPFDVEVTVGNVPDLDLTTNGDSGASTFDPLTGELNIPNYTLDGLGGVPESRTLTINGTTQDLSANRTFTIPAPDPVTIGSPANGLAIDGNQVLTIGLASVSQAGALSSTDWTTFNNKQNAIGYTPENVANKAINFTSPDDTKYPTTLAVSTALAGKQDLLTNPITGTGVAGQVSFWTGTGTQSGDSSITWNNTSKILVLGTIGVNGEIQLNRLTTGTSVGGIRAVPAGTEIGGNSYIDKILVGNGGGIDFFTYTGVASNTNQRVKIFASTGNVLIQNGGTFTDSGFRLDVNGTARVSTSIETGGGQIVMSVNQFLGYNGLRLRGGVAASTGGVSIGNLAGIQPNIQLFIRGYGNTNATTSLAVNSLDNRLLTILDNGNILAGTTTDVASSILTLESTTKGFLPPRMTGAQAEAISSPAEGLLVYSTDGTGTTITSKGWWGFDGSTWAQLN